MHHDNAVVVEWNSLVCTVYVYTFRVKYKLCALESIARMTERVPRCKGHAVVSLSGRDVYTLTHSHAHNYYAELNFNKEITQKHGTAGQQGTRTGGKAGRRRRDDTGGTISMA